MLRRWNRCSKNIALLYSRHSWIAPNLFLGSCPLTSGRDNNTSIAPEYSAFPIIPQLYFYACNICSLYVLTPLLYLLQFFNCTHAVKTLLICQPLPNLLRIILFFFCFHNQFFSLFTLMSSSRVRCHTGLQSPEGGSQFSHLGIHQATWYVSW